MKLNLGSGGRTDVGWIHVDREFAPETVARFAANFDTNTACVQHDLTDLPLPFADGVASMAVAHHVLDAFAEDDLAKLLGEVYRVLEPGGVLRVSSPNYEHAVRALVRADSSWFHNLGVPMQAVDGIVRPGDAVRAAQHAFYWYLFWGGARKTPLLSPQHLAFDFLEPAGFSWVVVAHDETTTRNGSICELDSRADESWFVEAIRP